MSSTAPSAGPITPQAHQRATLEEWKAKLESLIEQRRKCLRTTNRNLCVHLASAINSAHDAIAETCRPLRTALIGEAAAAVAPYFGRLGDAREAATRFPAVVAFNRELHSTAAGDTLDGLADRAAATVKKIARLLDGREVWRFQTGDS